MTTKRLVEKRPDYHHGQLLLEDDFLAEQRFHMDARRRHNLNCHGWGVVRGLEVIVKGGSSVTVRPGYAIDGLGRDIELDQAESIDVVSAEPGERVRISLAYEEEQGEGRGNSGAKRRECFAVITASAVVQEPSALILATVQLDDEGKVRVDSVDYSETRYARLPPGSVTAAELDSSLRTGWFRSPLRPVRLANKPKGEDAIPPAFRVGATQCLSPRPEPGEEEEGAAGTMEIPLPPSVRKITRLRLAGTENDGVITVVLLRGGWDPTNNDHARETLVNEEIRGEPFFKTFKIDQAKTRIDPEFHTLSLWLRGSGRTAISLVAVEFAY